MPPLSKGNTILDTHMRATFNVADSSDLDYIPSISGGISNGMASEAVVKYCDVGMYSHCGSRRGLATGSDKRVREYTHSPAAGEVELRSISSAYHCWRFLVNWPKNQSQLAALAELNSRGLIPVADLRKHYDKAVLDYPNVYSNYSFDQWMDFMKSRMLIARYPSQMVELSFNGKDFLKYLAHVGRDAKGRSY